MRTKIPKFDDFKEKDRVWSIEHGWGNVDGYHHGHQIYVSVFFDKDRETQFIYSRWRNVSPATLFFIELEIPNSAVERGASI